MISNRALLLGLVIICLTLMVFLGLNSYRETLRCRASGGEYATSESGVAVCVMKHQIDVDSAVLSGN